MLVPWNRDVFQKNVVSVAGRKALGRDSCNGDSGGPAYVKIGSGFGLSRFSWYAFTSLSCPLTPASSDS